MQWKKNYFSIKMFLTHFKTHTFFIPESRKFCFRKKITKFTKRKFPCWILGYFQYCVHTHTQPSRLSGNVFSLEDDLTGLWRHGYRNQYYHTRRIKTEEKAKVVAAVERIDQIPCGASYFAPGWFEERDEFIQFIESSWCHSSYSLYHPDAIHSIL